MCRGVLDGPIIPDNPSRPLSPKAPGVGGFSPQLGGRWGPQVQNWFLFL